MAQQTIIIKKLLAQLWRSINGSVVLELTK